MNMTESVRSPIATRQAIASSMHVTIIILSMFFDILSPKAMRVAAYSRTAQLRDDHGYRLRDGPYISAVNLLLVAHTPGLIGSLSRLYFPPSQTHVRFWVKGFPTASWIALPRHVLSVQTGFRPPVPLSGSVHFRSFDTRVRGYFHRHSRLGVLNYSLGFVSSKLEDVYLFSLTGFFSKYSCMRLFRADNCSWDGSAHRGLHMHGSSVHAPHAKLIFIASINWLYASSSPAAARLIQQPMIGMLITSSPAIPCTSHSSG